MTFSPIISTPPTQGQAISRALFLSILNAALSKGANEYRFARQSALQWLAIYPGDLQVSLGYAQALIGERRLGEARSVLKGLSMADPENLVSLQLWLSLERSSENRQAASLNNQVPANGQAGKANRQYSNQANGLNQPDILPDLNNWAAALDGRRVPAASETAGSKALLVWGEKLYAIRKSLQAGDIQIAEQEIPSLLGTETDSPLLALTHLEVLAANPATPLSARRSLAEFYHRRWPDCLVFSLLLGSWLVEEGSTERGVALLHQSAGRDVSGLVARRVLGPSHPYRTLWPENLILTNELIIPARVAAALGWNQLPSGPTVGPLPGEAIRLHSENETENKPLPVAAAVTAVVLENQADETRAGDKTPDEDIVRFSAELDRMAAALDELPASQFDGRYPVYVIFSVHSHLAAQYGAQGAAELELEMKQIAQTVSQHQASGQRSRWGATVFLPDQPESSNALGLSPLQTIDPWSLKLSLVDLDRALGKHGEMIGALLIVGGPEIVPFHNLPNPIDDPDAEVPSDNPYSTRDDNYFIPEWPVGRLPGEAGRDYSMLLGALRRIRDQRSNITKRTSRSKRWLGWITRWFNPSQRQFRKGFGYTAAVWRQASFQVFRPVGESKAVLISPPGSTNGNSVNGNHAAIPAARLGYFNLHGLADAPEWYGQRDPQTAGEGPDYPVAIHPDDVGTLGEKTPLVIFSEACYGAHILGKSTDQALALKFLETGTQVVAGSTTMSYGAMNAPLIAADLLGYCFWKGLLEGLTAGEALQQAKIRLASEMHQRQGYLDGEDQKTLISFVLYGDPLARLPDDIRQAKVRGSGNLRRLVGHPPTVLTVCDRATGVCTTVTDEPGEKSKPGNATEQVPEEVMSYVKQIVASYLPGMADAQATYSEERPECLAHNHTCPTNQLNALEKNRSKKQGSHQQCSQHEASIAEASQRKNNRRRVVILNNSSQKAGHTHHQIARLTLDSGGKLVKIVVSR